MLVATDLQSAIIETLRGRVLRGLRAGTLQAGDRLPSARELIAEFGADQRLILSAYRQLADESLIEIRERGGVYVTGTEAGNTDVLPLPVKWLAETFTEGYAREVSASELSEWVRRSIETLRLRVIVISSTEDQVAGLARELRDDFGLIAEGFCAESLGDDGVYPPAFTRADLFVGTSVHAPLVQTVSERFNKPSLMIGVRPDLVAGEWAMLLRQPVWAVVATPEFGEMLKRFFANVRGIENLRVLVLGRDDLSTIPEGAPTYVTQRVRESIGETMRGRILPAARTISVESARQIFEFIVRANLRAVQAIQERPGSVDPRR